MTTRNTMDSEGSDQDRSPAAGGMRPLDEPEDTPLPAILLAARQADDVATAVGRLSPRASTWILVLRAIDDAARQLKHALLEAGHECLLIHADFHEPGQRMQALAIARDFAGEITFMWDCTGAPTQH